MKGWICCWCIFAVSGYADIDSSWLDEVKHRTHPQTTEWLRECLKNEFKEKKEQQALTGTRCLVSPSEQIAQPSLFIFISFSVPEATWLSLSKEASRLGGVTFVLQGLPENSFIELAKRLLKLKEQGLAIQVDIDPVRFRKYGITTVPTFVVQGPKSFDKLSGHISLAYALEYMAQRGETEDARQFHDRLNEEKKLL